MSHPDRVLPDPRHHQTKAAVLERMWSFQPAGEGSCAWQLRSGSEWPAQSRGGRSLSPSKARVRFWRGQAMPPRHPTGPITLLLREGVLRSSNSCISPSVHSSSCNHHMYSMSHCSIQQPLAAAGASWPRAIDGGRGGGQNPRRTGMEWDEMGCNGIELDAMGRNGTKWDEMK